MAKSEKQKLKLLYILKILQEETDEKHCISTQQLIEKLSSYEINAERKSIYSDVQYLNDFGYEVKSNPSKQSGGYYLAKRDFELPELKLLVDVVSASKFLTLKKSKDLIKKLELLACSHEGKELQRQVYVANRIKTQNESVFDNADVIHKAINENRKIEFQYFEWTTDKKMNIRKNGKKYLISPFAVTVYDENYYMIGFDHMESKIKHYRVDKMLSVSVTGERREGKEYFDEFDLATYLGKTFGMYGGEEDTLTLLFPNRLIGVVIDRFGKDVEVRKRDEEHFSVRVKVAVSNQLYGWIAGLGVGSRILMPKEEAEKYAVYLKELYHEQMKQ